MQMRLSIAQIISDTPSGVISMRPIGWLHDCTRDLWENLGSASAQSNEMKTD